MATDRSRRHLTLLVTLLFIGFLIEQAPHTVHHAFESDPRDECVFAANAERVQGAIGDVPDLTLVADPGRRSVAEHPPAAPLRALVPTDARAPPPSTP